MLKALLSGLRLLVLVLGGHKQVALENLALRHQIAVLRRNVRRPKLRQRDRFFWMTLARVWANWKAAVVIVRPETVIGWQRRRFKRYWWKLSQSKGPGRPRVPAEVRMLVQKMAAANPLWGAPRIHGELLKLGFDISERSVVGDRQKVKFFEPAPTHQVADASTHGTRILKLARANVKSFERCPTPVDTA